MFKEFGQLLNRSKKSFELSVKLQIRLSKLSAISIDKKIERSPYKVLQSKKATICRLNLKKRHFQLIFIIHKMVI